MLATMESVRGVNVPMYTTLRRTTVVFTMFVEFILVGQKYSRSVIGRVISKSNKVRNNRGIAELYLYGSLGDCV
nr:nucleotide-sugar uncharacterized transporter 3 [Tanacetum cinerariifolium]